MSERPYFVSEPVSEANELTEARKEIARLIDRLDHSVPFEAWNQALADLDYHMRESEERLRLIAEGALREETLLAEHRRMRAELCFCLEESRAGSPMERILDKITDEIPER